MNCSVLVFCNFFICNHKPISKESYLHAILLNRCTSINSIIVFTNLPAMADKHAMGFVRGASNFLGIMFNKIPFDAEVDVRFYGIL